MSTAVDMLTAGDSMQPRGVEVGYINTYDKRMTAYHMMTAGNKMKSNKLMTAAPRITKYDMIPILLLANRSNMVDRLAVRHIECKGLCDRN